MHASVEFAQYPVLMMVCCCLDILLARLAYFSLGWSSLNTLLKYSVCCYSAIVSILCGVQLF